GDGGLLQGRGRALQRDLGEEPEVQEDLRQLEAVPRRAEPVVPGRGQHLRQLHDPAVSAERALSRSRARAAREEREGPALTGGAFLLGTTGRRYLMMTAGGSSPSSVGCC